MKFNFTQEDMVPLGSALRLCVHCGTREKITKSVKGSAICDNCFNRGVGKETKIELSDDYQTGPVIHSVQANPVNETLATSHVNIDGKVYDLELRPKECNHSEAKDMAKYLNKEFNYCFNCGYPLKKRALPDKPEKPIKKDDKKVKVVSSSKKRTKGS